MTPSSREGQEALALLRGAGAALTLAGGDVEAIAAWARAARAAGFSRVAAAPGPRGLPAGALSELMAAGVDGLRARLYAAEAGAHDYHAGVEGSFRATVATLREARVSRLPTTVTTPLTRSNLRVLAALPGLLADVAARGWCVATSWSVGGEGAAARPSGALTPRLGVALPYALQAMSAAERAGVVTAIAGAPLCLLGPLRDRSLGGPTRAFAEQCGGCGLRPGCPGVDDGYLRRFGAGELSSVAGERPSPGGREAQRRRRVDVFSGPWLAVSEGARWPL